MSGKSSITITDNRTGKSYELPVENGVSVDRISSRENGYVVSAAGREIEARQVVVAMANYQKPVVPSFARELRSIRPIRALPVRAIGLRRLVCSLLSNMRAQCINASAHR